MLIDLDFPSPGTKYCPLLEKERGTDRLEELVLDPRPYRDIQLLAQQVLDRCQRFHSDPDYDSSNEGDNMDDDDDVPMDG